MKKFALAFAILAAVPLAAAADVTKEDIKKLVAAGISDDVILSYIRNNGPVTKLSADDVIELKQAGASDRVLSAMAGESSAPAARASANATVTERLVERQYVPQTTYVYSTPTYSYPTYYSSYPAYYPTYYSGSYCYPSYSYYPRYSYYYPSVGFAYYGGRYSVGVGYGYGYRGGVSYGYGYRGGWCR